jgi:hypothetical protein
MSHTNLRRALWICDYFPRPHDTASGTWALENTVALQTAGLPTVALAPTPWIPRPLAVTSGLVSRSAFRRDARCACLLSGLPSLSEGLGQQLRVSAIAFSRQRISVAMVQNGSRENDA